MREQEPRQPDTGPVPFPFPLPEDFLPRLGYPRARRFVAAFWEPAGDEAAWSDGEYTLIGANQWVFAELADQPSVRTWLLEQEVNLGSSDQEATHWLVVDRHRDEAYVTAARQGRAIVRTQRLEEGQAGVSHR